MNHILESCLKQSIRKEYLKYEHEINTDGNIKWLFHEYAHWKARFLRKSCTTVYHSKELKANNLFKDKRIQKIIKKIEYKIKNNEDITPFLSTGVVDNPINNSNNKKGMDVLLNAFNIHHLHLGEIYNNRSKRGINFAVNKNFRRENILLYITKQDNVVYFLDVMEHEYRIIDLFRIIKNNWEFLIKDFETSYLKYEPSDDSYENDTIRELIKSGVSVPIAIGNKMYMLNPITMSGHNGMKRFSIEAFFQRIEHQYFILINDTYNIKRVILSQFSIKVNEIDIQIEIIDGLLYFIEKSSKSTILMNHNDNSFIIYEGYCKSGCNSYDFNG